MVLQSPAVAHLVNSKTKPGITRCKRSTRFDKTGNNVAVADVTKTMKMPPILKH